MNPDLAFLQRSLHRLLARLLPEFCLDASDRNGGGFVDPATRYAGSRESIYFGQLLFAAYLYPEYPEHYGRPEMLERLRAHLGFLRRRQRADGSVMLGTGGVGTGAEVGFTLPGMCETYRRVAASGLPGRDEILPVLAEYIQRGAACVRAGFAATSNHRWAAFAGPLAVAHGLFPHPDNAAVIEGYLADGIDIDADGLYYEERSPIYNEVANYGLLFLADHWGRRDLLDLVARNLRCTLALRQPNGEAETLFSHRQDRGRAEWRWGDYFLFRRLAVEQDDPVFATAADRLRRQHDGEGELAAFTPLGLSVPLRYYYDDPRLSGPDDRPRAALPETFELRFGETPIWRWRDGPVAATVSADRGGHWWDVTQGTWGGLQRADNWLSLQAGLAAIDGIKLRWGAGTGGFRPDRIEYRPDGRLALRYTDPGWPHVAHFRPREKWGPRLTVADQRGEVLIACDPDGRLELEIRIEGWADMPVEIQLLLRENGTLRAPDGTVAALPRGGRTHVEQAGDWRLTGPDGSHIVIAGLPAGTHRMPFDDRRTITGLAEQRCHRLLVDLFTPVHFKLTLDPRPATAAPNH